ncbi:MAG: biotin transporter BioY [Spirochaetales bacterium]|nr:biotin transporter BioY [Spirochaetales bacterium]
MKRGNLKSTVYISAFAALMVLGVFIRIPLGPVPIVMTNFFVLLAGYLLGPVSGSAAVLLYLFLGAAGLPVFSAGGGAALFLGPTGGYLAGYLPAALLTGFLADKNRRNKTWADILIFTLGALIIYLPGVLWLSHVTGLPFKASLQTGMLPFLPGDILKIAAATAVARRLKNYLPELFPPAKNGRDQ